MSCFVSFLSFILAVYTPMLFAFNFEYPLSSFLLLLRLCRSRGVPMITRLQMINVESLLLFPGQWVCMIFLYFIYLLLIFLFDYVLRKWEWWKGWILIWNQMGCFWFCKCEIVNCIFIKLGLKIWVCICTVVVECPPGMKWNEKISVKLVPFSNLSRCNFMFYGKRAMPFVYYSGY